MPNIVTQDILTEHMLLALETQGVLGAAARHHLTSPGKQIRGRLALQLHEVLHKVARGHHGPRKDARPREAWDTAGAPTGPGLDLGLACELLHNASLIHDDVQDRDALRRSRPSVWQRFGPAIAISLGDHLIIKAFGRVCALSAEFPELGELFTEATSTVIRGQSDELVCRGDTTITANRYEHMAAGKTGAMLALPIAGSLILGKRPARTIRAGRRIANLLGVAFQIADDIADLEGRKGRGDAGADLVEGKITWPMISFLAERAEGSRRDFAAMLGSERRRIVEAPHWVREIQASGALDRSATRCNQLLRRAERLMLATQETEFATVIRSIFEPLLKLPVRREAKRSALTA